ncbi:ATP-binding protein [Anaerotruncus rubiinfantis]|uniref:ATP-binding protein n=1 Tax=Anaerotruncus rubiinfantis TaxID=1720200 RepID=UPI001FA7F966|nr:ATP-binding protein [Anaerotruncus rubiinfantis]
MITEALLREELRHEQPKTYCVEKGKILSPAAREYLQQRKITVAEAAFTVERKSKELKLPEKADTPSARSAQRYIDYRTGAAYEKKPEHMTQLHDNYLVEKSHPRIAFRGWIDNLQAEIILAQTVVCKDHPKTLVKDLDELLNVVRQIVRCEVMEEPMTSYTLLGLDADGLREHSHHPQKYYRIKQMLLPDYSMGEAYARLNLIRTKVRQAETVGTKAFWTGRTYEHTDILEALNRLSSAVHIMMCKYLAGDYNDGK